MQTETEAVVEPEVVDPADEVVVETPTEEAEDKNTEGDLTDETPKPKNGVQARIDELTRKLRQTERERDAYAGIAPQTAQNSSTDAEPDPEDFDDNAAYIKAVAAHAVSQALNGQRQVQTEAVRAADWADRVEAVKSTLTDFDTVVGQSDLDISNIADALMESDQGPQLAYHLAQNPDLAMRLNAMSPIRAAVELGKLGMQLSGVPVKKASGAPVPITPLNGGSSVTPDLAKADMETFIKTRRGQGARY